VALPPLETKTVCDGLSGVDIVSVNATAVADNPITGTPTTTKVTVTVCGELLATPDMTDTVAVYVPAESEPLVALKVSVAGAVAWFSVAVSQPLGPVP
jgi:hypothetical protein